MELVIFFHLAASSFRQQTKIFSMTTLMDRHGKPCAYLYNNKLLLAGSMEVMGVTLGDCVFGRSGEVKGKIFDKGLYSISGETVAMEEEMKTIPNFDPMHALFQGWEILEKIKDHSCPWIIPKNKWLALGIEEFLTMPGVVTIVKVKNNKALHRM